MRKMSKDEVVRILLPDSEIPKQWYNVVADMPNKPAPYYSPMTGKPATAGDMEAIFPRELILQERSQERFIDIPNEVREMYR